MLKHAVNIFITILVLIICTSIYVFLRKTTFVKLVQENKYFYTTLNGISTLRACILYYKIEPQTLFKIFVYDTKSNEFKYKFFKYFYDKSKQILIEEIKMEQRDPLYYELNEKEKKIVKSRVNFDNFLNTSKNKIKISTKEKKNEITLTLDAGNHEIREYKKEKKIRDILNKHKIKLKYF